MLDAHGGRNRLQNKLKHGLYVTNRCGDAEFNIGPCLQFVVVLHREREHQRVSALKWYEASCTFDSDLGDRLWLFLLVFGLTFLPFLRLRFPLRSQLLSRPHVLRGRRLQLFDVRWDESLSCRRGRWTQPWS